MPKEPKGRRKPKTGRGTVAFPEKRPVKPKVPGTRDKMQPKSLSTTPKKGRRSASLKRKGKKA